MRCARARPDPTRPAIGQPLARVEDERFLTGSAQFVDDLARPGLLHAVLVRSAHASGRLRAIDASAASRVSTGTAADCLPSASVNTAARSGSRAGRNRRSVALEQ